MAIEISVLKSARESKEDVKKYVDELLERLKGKFINIVFLRYS